LQAGLIFVSCCWWGNSTAYSGKRVFLKLNSYRPNLTAQVPASATVIYVNSATGTDSPSAGNTEAAPYKKSHYALSQAQPTVIQLAPGNYTSETGSLPLVIKQGVTLRGDESTKGKNTVISGGGRYISPTLPDRTLQFEPRKIALPASPLLMRIHAARHCGLNRQIQRSRTILPIVTGTAFYHRYSYPKLRITSSLGTAVMAFQ